MDSSRAVGLLRFLRGLTTPDWAEHASDVQLLQRFAAGHDEAAFTALVRRHGAMVFSVCRRVLPEAQDAEDAFQAAFLVLARRVRSIARPELLGNWLYGVAYRTALEAKRAARRRLKERRAPDLKAEDPAEAAAWADLRPVLDEEVSRLPEKYRAPFVLCHLEGRTNEEAAQVLGCPRGTVLSRLAWARQRLRARLTRRGVTLAGGALVSTGMAEAGAGVPEALVGTTARAAAALAGGEAALGALVSVRVVALMRGVLTAMTMKKLRSLLMPVLVAVVLALGGAVGYRAVWAEQEPRQSAAGPPGEVRPAQAPRPRQAESGVGWGEARTFRTAHTSGYPRLAFPPVGKGLVIASPQLIFASPQLISTLDLTTGKEVQVKQDPREPPYRFLGFSPRGHLLAYRLLGQSPDRPRIVSLSDLTAGKELARVEPEGDLRSLAAVALSPDGRTLALAQPLSVALWDVETGKRLGTLETRGGTVRYFIHVLAFSPDGKWLAAGSGTSYPVGKQVNGAVAVWDVRTRKLLHDLPNRESQVNALAFSPDGNLVAGGGIHSMGLRVWEVETGKERYYLKHPDANQFFAVAFAPDGKTLAANWRVAGSGNNDAGVALWETATGRLRGILKGLRGTVRGVAFSPDGRRLAAIDGEGTVRLWEPGQPAARPRP
jgi:RNA polymerase sigma factor (sigma-70 family)